MARRIYNHAEHCKQQRRAEHIADNYQARAREALTELEQSCQRLTDAFTSYKEAIVKVRGKNNV